jgi:hypothetical protein
MKITDIIKQLEDHNLEFQNRLNAANNDCDVWQWKYETLEGLQKGYVKMRIEDLAILQGEALKTAQYKKAADESRETRTASFNLLKEIAQILEMEENQTLVDIPKLIQLLQIENKRLSNLLEPNYRQQDAYKQSDFGADLSNNEAYIQKILASSEIIKEVIENQDADKISDVTSLKEKRQNISALSRFSHNEECFKSVNPFLESIRENMD